MNHLFVKGLVGWLALATVTAIGQSPQPSYPHLEPHGNAKRLIVNGRPLLMLAGELSNSSSSSLESMIPIWPKMVQDNFNTVLLPLAGDFVEPWSYTQIIA